MPRIEIQTYSRKPLIGRRQYHARIVSAFNGEIIWRLSEGYNNREDRDDAIALLGLPADVEVYEVGS